jgi:tRNA A-37 threonylcarbamoyl transferase component Bud32
MANIGTVVAGKYRIERLIGKGGMSKVYLALDTRLGKHWAIKEIEKNVRDAQKNKVVTNSALAEANLIKGLDNYYLPRISDILDNGQTIYVIMDYVEGEALKSVLAREGAQGQDRVIKWGKQLCQVLHYLHTRKPPIIYRDMKPGNVMIKPDGDIKLIDFGIAREYTQGNGSDTTSLGTRGYAAPEQFDASAQSDMRTDIYNLGATLYHAVTGHDPSKPPYEMKPVRSWVPSLSPELEKIIKKCTNADPKRRYQRAAQLLEALQGLGGVDEATLSVADTGDDETTILSEYVPPAGVSAGGAMSAGGRSGVLSGVRAAGGGSGMLHGAGKPVYGSSGVSPGAGSAAAVGAGPASIGARASRRIKPLYLAIAAVAVALAVILAVVFSAGPEPNDVRGLDGKPQGLSSIALSWDPSEKADGYEVAIVPTDAAAYDGTGKTPPQPLEVGETSAVVGGLLCDASYLCEVRAFTDDENKRIYQKGKIASVDVKTAAPDMSVGVLTATAAGYDEVNLKWVPLPITEAAISYRLLAAGAADGEYKEQYAGTAAEFAAKGLAPQTAYFYKVVAAAKIDGKDFSGESAVAGVTTGAVQLAPPSIDAESTGYSTIYIKWGKSEIAGAKTKYILERSKKKNSGFRSAYNGEKRENTDTGLDDSTRYYYRVTAVVSIAGKEFRATSQVASAKTKARPVSTPQQQPSTRPIVNPGPDPDGGGPAV